jgi:hypothetical protein
MLEKKDSITLYQLPGACLWNATMTRTSTSLWTCVASPACAPLENYTLSTEMPEDLAEKPPT